MSHKSIFWIVGAILVPVVAVMAFLYTASADEGKHTATVARVIDGDTLDVFLDHEKVRVRLLNVDTPETQHPDEVIECLGPEASDFLTDLLPQGTEIVLEYDEQREDQYGRLLAGVFLQGDLVNAQIAAQGLGIAVVYEPNRKFYEPVKAAEESARDQQRGLFDPQVECTLPHQMADLQDQVDALPEALPEDIEAIDAALAEVEAVEALVSDFSVLLTGQDDEMSLLHSAYGAVLGQYRAQLDRNAESLTQQADRLHEQQAELEREAERRKQEEERQRQEAEEERKREEAEAERQREVEAEAERQRQVEAEAERQRQVEAEEQRRRNAQTQTTTPSGQGGGSGGSSPSTPRGSSGNSQPSAPQGNSAPSGYGTDADYPGYTGPRCYAPGGRFWRPC